METIEIKATVDTPFVFWDPDNGILQLKGRSYPENPQEFYAPIFKWIKDIAESGIRKLEISFYMEYFNTTSFKIIFDIMFELESINATYGIDVQINWYYDSYSLDIKEAGSDLSELINLPFNICEKVF